MPDLNAACNLLLAATADYLAAYHGLADVITDDAADEQMEQRDRQLERAARAFVGVLDRDLAEAERFAQLARERTGR